jgi:hypothetical protein
MHERSFADIQMKRRIAERTLHQLVRAGFGDRQACEREENRGSLPIHAEHQGLGVPMFSDRQLR